jgi:hypothetical protein
MDDDLSVLLEDESENDFSEEDDSIEEAADEANNNDTLNELAMLNGGDGFLSFERTMIRGKKRAQTSPYLLNLQALEGVEGLKFEEIDTTQRLEEILVKSPARRGGGETKVNETLQLTAGKNMEIQTSVEISPAK